MSYFNIGDIIKFVFPSSVLIGVVGWLIRSLIKHLLDKDITSMKITIESEAKKQIELYKSKLEIERNILQIRYSGIFEKQAEAIIRLYKDLEDFSQKAELALANAGSDTETKEVFRRSFYRTKDSYTNDRIFLPGNVDKLCVDFFTQMFKSVWTYSRYEEGMRLITNETKFNEIWKKQEKALDIIQKKLPEIKSELISKFRFLLGIESGNEN